MYFNIHIYIRLISHRAAVIEKSHQNPIRVINFKIRILEIAFEIEFIKSLCPHLCKQGI